MIPEIYDTERDIRVRNVDDSETFVPINTTVGTAVKEVEENPERFKGIDHNELRSIFSKEGKDAKYNDVTSGKYDVVVTTGPSYATQRQEAAQHLLQLVQSMPAQMGLAADIIVENMDFKGAEELAGRLRKALPPGMAKLRDGEQPPPPAPPNPEVLLAQAKLESEKIKVAISQARLQAEQIKLQQPPPEVTGPSQVDIQMEQMKLEMEQLRNQTESQRLMADQKSAALRAQTESERLHFQNQQQELAIIQQRESHKSDMELAQFEAQRAQTEMIAKRDPLNIRKSNATA